MNDFTKEELEVLLLSFMCSDFFNEKPWHKFHEKIKAMIDNYCEHDWQYSAGEYNQCDKCGQRD